MATFATAVLPATDSQMAFQTPFVSQSVNRKATAIIPTGIYRGFNATALGFTVTIEPDPSTLDSVAVCRTINASLAENHYNVTIRHEGPIVIDYTGVSSYPNTIVLEARYDLTGTAPVEGLTEVRVKVVDPGDVMPYHVVLATVTGGPPIPDTSVADVTGGALVTPNQLNATQGTVSEVTDDSSGVFTTASPVLVPVPSPIMSWTQTTTGNVGITLTFTHLPGSGGTGQGVSQTYGCVLDGVTYRVLGSRIADLEGVGGVSGTTVFSAVPPGLHTVTAALAYVPVGFTTDAKIDRGATTPLRIVRFVS